MVEEFEKKRDKSQERRKEKAPRSFDGYRKDREASIISKI